MYGVEVYGYETFVVEERLWNGQTRNGGCYRADNWELVGLTKGYGKTNTRGRTHNNKLLQSKKLIYCIKNKNKKLCTEYRLLGILINKRTNEREMQLCKTH